MVIGMFSYLPVRLAARIQPLETDDQLVSVRFMLIAFHGVWLMAISKSHLISKSTIFVGSEIALTQHIYGLLIMLETWHELSVADRLGGYIRLRELVEEVTLGRTPQSETHREDGYASYAVEKLDIDTI